MDACGFEPVYRTLHPTCSIVRCPFIHLCHLAAATVHLQYTTPCSLLPATASCQPCRCCRPRRRRRLIRLSSSYRAKNSYPVSLLSLTRLLASVRPFSTPLEVGCGHATPSPIPISPSTYSTIETINHNYALPLASPPPHLPAVQVSGSSSIPCST